MRYGEAKLIVEVVEENRARIEPTLGPNRADLNQALQDELVCEIMRRGKGWANPDAVRGLVRDAVGGYL